MASNASETVEICLAQGEKNEISGAERVLQFVQNTPGDYGAPLPENDDVKHDFFAKGRDLESAFVNHKYTDAEKKLLGEYESLDYLPPHSTVYRQWIQQQPARIDWDYWVMMGLIGFLVGCLGFFLHQFIDVFAELKWNKARKFIEESNFVYAWLWVISISVLFVFISSSSVVILRPSAGGSGLPEIIAYLNGTIVRHIFNVKTLAIKFISCTFAVASGMPVGPEGPMIHLGSLVGAGCSQLKSSTLKINLPFFKRFRNSEDRRNFISAGAAAGVASAFGSPVGGLLFSMEEVSSFWNMKLSWQTFFCCMVSTFTSDLLNSAFTAFHYEGNFGLFKTEKYILFEVVKRIDLNVIALVPTVVVGILGGFLGATFTFLNLKITRARRNFLSSIKSKKVQMSLQISEPIIIMIIMGTFSVYLPTLLSCSTFTCNQANKMSECILRDGIRIENNVELYNCPAGKNNSGTMYNTSYNEVATLLFLTGDRAIHHLFSRETHLEFNFIPLLVVLPCYFILACWAAGTSISSGVVIPKMFIGGLIGRIVGRLMVEAFGVQTELYWSWMDPGAFALIGAAAFFGGVSRLTMSLTIIMVELTNDVQFLLLIMVAIMVSKWVGDYVTHPFYHAQLELKCIPFLDSEPIILFDGKRNLNLELFEACHVMSSPVITLETVVPVSYIAKLLLKTRHSGFPIVKKSNGLSAFYGLLTRTELSVLLCHEEIFDSSPDIPVSPLSSIDYSQFCGDDVEKLGRSVRFLDLLSHLKGDDYLERYLNLVPYVNKSAVCVQEEFSLHRAYIIFRSLGLRHLTVINKRNEVVGIITRKDLMGYNIEEKLLKVLNQRSSCQEMMPLEDLNE